MTRRRIAACLGVVALVVWAVWWFRRGHNGLGVKAVVLITLDTVRADRLGCYGGDGGLTPRLDQLAAEGVRFQRTLTTAPITLPAHASILSGTDPLAHGVRVNGAFTFGRDNPTLAAVMKDKGFKTGAFVSAFVLDRRFGLNRGFDDYNDVDERSEERGGEETVAAALDFVDQCGMAPFFLWVHLFDAHAPYEAPAPFSSRGLSAYDAEVAYVDHCVGRLLDGLAERERLEDALVAVVADHGEGLGDHGESGHTVFVYDSTMHVPMLLWAPAHLAGDRVIKGTSSVTALAPTLLDLLDHERPAGMYGRSYADAIRAETPDVLESAPVYFESLATEFYYGLAPLQGVDVGGDKLIVAPRGELYHIPNDPGETDNRFAVEGALAGQLKRRLDEYIRERSTERSEPRELSSSETSALAELGYTQNRNLGDLRDPKDAIAVIEALILAADAAGADLDRAVALLADLADKNPAMPEIKEQLGNLQKIQADIAAQAGDPAAAQLYEAALESFLAARAHREGDPVLLVAVGSVLRRLGRLDEAKVSLRAALTLEPTDVKARIELASVLFGEGVIESARRLFDEVLEGDLARGLQPNPNVPEALFGRAMCLKQAGNLRLAVDDLQRAVQLRPDNLQYWWELAIAHEQLGQIQEAIGAYEKVNEIAPAALRGAVDEALRRLRG